MNFTQRLIDISKLEKDAKYFEAENMYINLIKDLENLNSDTLICVKLKYLLLAEAHNNLGYILYKKVQFDEAVLKYNKAIEFNDEFAIAYYNRGTIHYRMGDYHLAVKDMEKASLLNPSHPEFAVALEECQRAVMNLKN